MSLSYFVEILNHNGDVQTRHAFDDLPLRIGRAYSNDIILDDPYVAADHAIIERDETDKIIIRDLGSLNGLKIKSHRHQQWSVRDDDIIQLGHTAIRLRTRHSVVAAERIDNHSNHWDGLPMIAAAVAIIGTLSLFTTWIGNIDDAKKSVYMMELLTWISISAVWAGAWAVTNRIFSGSARFSRHLFTLAAGLAAFDILGYTCSIIAYAFSWELFTRYSSHLQIALVVTILYFHLRTVSPRHSLRLKMICLSLSLIGSGWILMRNYQNTNQYSDELYMHDLLPPVLRVSSNHSVSDFSRDISVLKRDIDAERERTLKDKADAKK